MRHFGEQPLAVRRAPVRRPVHRRLARSRRHPQDHVAHHAVPVPRLCAVVSGSRQHRLCEAAVHRRPRLSNAAYGLGAGIFFFGYFVFEVPSNLLLKKFGARATIARITMLWGLLSCLMMFVRSETMFYVLRFFLGVAEAGLVPGVVLYLTFWFPSDRRARMVAVFMAAIPVAGIIGAPLSGFLMSALHEAHGLRGWQWMFLIEGIPSILAGFWALAWSAQHARRSRLAHRR